MHGISKVYEMYLLMLKTFEEIHKVAEDYLETKRNKKLPTEEDLNPNLRFVNNPILQALRSDSGIAKAYEKHATNWLDNEQAFRNIFQEIRESEKYDRYMNTETDEQADRDILIDLFKDHVVNNESLHHHFEEHSIYWQDDLDLACLAVIRTIKGINAGSSIQLADLYKDPKDDLEFITQLFDTTILQYEENTEFIMGKTRNWEADRIASMDMLLMQMAITEVREFPEIPIKVTLNEYIEISKFYSTPKSNGFINGVLDKVFGDLKASGQIKKVGRGLIG